MRRRFTTEQIIRILREAERKLAAGQGVPEVCRQLDIGESSYYPRLRAALTGSRCATYRWKAKYQGMQESEARRLRELEHENARLKRIVAEQAIGISILREAAKGNY